MGATAIVLIVIGAITLFSVLFVIGKYNGLVALRNRFKNFTSVPKWVHPAVGGALTGGLAVVALVVLTACSGSTPAAGSGRSAGSGSTPAGAVTVMLTSGPLGQYLSDGSGRALYMWAADTDGRSTCYRRARLRGRR